MITISDCYMIFGSKLLYYFLTKSFNLLVNVEKFAFVDYFLSMDVLLLYSRHSARSALAYSWAAMA